MMYGLTRRQADLLQFIREYMEKSGGVAPSHQEMAEGMGLASKSDIHRMLDSLEERGAIMRLPYRNRAIIPADYSRFVPGDTSTTCGANRASGGGACNTSRRSDQPNLKRR